MLNFSFSSNISLFSSWVAPDRVRLGSDDATIPVWCRRSVLMGRLHGRGFHDLSGHLFRLFSFPGNHPPGFQGLPGDPGQLSQELLPPPFLAFFAGPISEPAVPTALVLVLT